jgi:FtsP/CotA-like multicopper oxidase with cupredoxin domain
MSKIKKGVKTPSRRKFFKAAAATGAAAAATVAMPHLAFGAPQTLKPESNKNFEVINYEIRKITIRNTR